MNPRPVFLVLACCLSLPTLHANAEVKTYGGAHVGMLNFEVDDVAFRPWFAGLQAGMQTESGAGMEIAAATGVVDDESNKTEMSLNYSAQAYLTYSLYDDFDGPRRGQLLLGGGYAIFDTNTNAGSSDYPGDQSWDGPALMIRYSEYLPSYPKVNLAASYEHYYLDGKLSVAQFTLGVSYDF
ncbi:outer membrane beta-barrel protein [Hahella ganghwensis]|uniref:outer membrane beta-barrel protein n=1 Tax=Hahella ganghwensis TaxID=286420 RepID=UPI000366E736|nr:outer membrane beta-barrel protein [Hahella ganghwensis]